MDAAGRFVEQGRPALVFEHFRVVIYRGVQHRHRFAAAVEHVQHPRGQTAGLAHHRLARLEQHLHVPAPAQPLSHFHQAGQVLGRIPCIAAAQVDPLQSRQPIAQCRLDTGHGLPKGGEIPRLEDGMEVDALHALRPGIAKRRHLGQGHAQLGMGTAGIVAGVVQKGDFRVDT